MVLWDRVHYIPLFRNPLVSRLGRRTRKRFTQALARFEVLNYRWPDLPKNPVAAERTLDLGCHVQLFSGQSRAAVYAFIDESSGAPLYWRFGRRRLLLENVVPGARFHQRSLYVLIIYVQFELRVSWFRTSLRSRLLCLFRGLRDRGPASSEEERKSCCYCYPYDNRDRNLEGSGYDHDV